jgi:hypothetical protein
MKCWKIVDAGDFRTYARDFLIFYAKNPNKFKHCNSFWAQFIPENYDTYLQNNKCFKEGISMFGEINEIALLTMNGPKTSIHIDHTVDLNRDVKARLNIPLMNCEGSYTAFYNFTPEEFNQFKLSSVNRTYGDHVSKGTTKWWDFDDSVAKPATKVELIQPTILRTSYPHSVTCEGKRFPRITMTISFKEDLSKYLC